MALFYGLDTARPAFKSEAGYGTRYEALLDVVTAGSGAADSGDAWTVLVTENVIEFAETMQGSGYRLPQRSHFAVQIWQTVSKFGCPRSLTVHQCISVDRRCFVVYLRWHFPLLSDHIVGQVTGAASALLARSAPGPGFSLVEAFAVTVDPSPATQAILT